MRAHADHTSVDLLRREDTRLLEIFAELDDCRTGEVLDRARYGDLAKQVIRHEAVREAAVADVAHGIEHEPGFEGIATHMMTDERPRREALDRVEHMSRGVPPMALNTGQDFDTPLTALVALLDPEIRWELDTALPAIRLAESGGRGAPAFHSERKIEHHAPTNLSPKGPKWYERAPVVSRLMTYADHMRDYPRAVRGHRN